ncbi:hypothetical protein [Synechococcus sp. CS-1332]|uniref:hypothetical protein n=1 Tax=Synechococcus sp. CS-1332 TaxID=2847972 RepID=UPI00223B17CB|nr:hypothetical protein [Synechococcus sp. CS-1332]MCT0207076.1 hypothetical protein [Synechococcus sp. CS-1332]
MKGGYLAVHAAQGSDGRPCPSFRIGPSALSGSPLAQPRNLVLVNTLATLFSRSSGAQDLYPHHCL